MTDVQAIRERAEKATGGPPDQYWHLDSRWPDDVITFGGNTVARVKHPFDDRALPGNVSADLNFIAHAREDIPMLVKVLAEAEKKLEAVEELRIPHAYKCSCYDDDGECDCYRRALDAILGGSE